MTNIRFNTLAAAALLGAALVTSAPAYAAPAGPSAVAAAIEDLESQGYTVVVERVGGAVAENCTIASVRPGQVYSRTDTGAPGAGTSLVTTLMSKTVYVALSC